MKGRLLFYAVLIYGILSHRQVNAQQTCELQLSGQVKDHHDQSPLGYAVLLIEENGKGVISDSLGNFSFQNLCEGKITLVCIHVGCDTLRKHIDLNKNMFVELLPEHHKESIWKIELTDIAPEDKATQSVNEIKGRDLDNIRGLSLGESLRSLPGVSVLNTGATIAKPVIHGLHSNRILILNNGIRQEGQQWGNEHAPEIDPFTAGRLRVVKGAAAVRYGSDAIGGVILVEPSPLSDSSGWKGEWNFAGGWNGRTAATAARLDYQPAKVSALFFRAQGSLRAGGNLRCPDYYLANTGMREYNFSGGAGYRKFAYGGDVYYSQFNSKIGIFSGSHIGNLTDLLRAFESPSPLDTAGFSYSIGRPWQNIEHELVKTSGYIRAGRAGKLSIQLARQFNRHKEFDKHQAAGDSSGTIPALQFEITTHSGEILFEHNRFHRFEGSVGVFFMTQKNTYEGRFFIPNFRNQYGGIFLIERWKKDKLEAEAGVRFDVRKMEVFLWQNGQIVSPKHTFQNFSGTLGALYELNHLFSLNVHLGSAWRAPGVNELYSAGLHHGAAAVEYGKADLQPEKVLNTSVSGKFIHKRLQAEIGAYLNLFDHYIYLKPVQPASLTIRGAFPTFAYDQAPAIFRGIDLDAELFILSWFSAEFKGSAVRASNPKTGEYFVMIPPDRGELRFNFIQEKAGPFRGLRISTGVTATARQKRVEPGSDYVPPPPGFFLLNAEISAELHAGKIPLSFGLSGTNLLNTRYREYLDRFRYFADAMGRNVMVRVGVIW